MPASYQLSAPESYRLATAHDIARTCNGCGTKGLGGWLVPDTLFGLDIGEACDIHDWRYSEGTCWRDKDVADWEFLSNMLTIINANTGWLAYLLRPFRIHRAWAYYEAVRAFGRSAYAKGKNL
jgi:hypothetical protein